MQVFKINTSSWTEEDFYLLTSLNEEQISKIIQPMTQYERTNDIVYTNDDYIQALETGHPKAKIQMYTEFETLSF